MLGVVVGLEAEARLARRFPGAVDVAVGGGTSDGARRAAERLLAAGARGLVSLGLAAGLSPDVAPGSLIVPRRVRVEGMPFPTDRDLCRLLGGMTPHDLLHSERIIASIHDKQRLHQTTRCAALDMESGAVARAALAEARPFAVLRAVCDPAWRALPPVALVSMSPMGKLALGRLLASLGRHPGQLTGLAVLARDAWLARQALGNRISSIRSFG